ncbi:MAG TPA: hypothetical protein VHF02_03100 [Luteimonas sp.]|nr:hypothetical protein [Luteimonas sp.]
MDFRLRASWLFASLACTLVACVAPAPQPAQGSTTTAARDAIAAPAAPAQAPSAPPPDLRKLKPRTGGPLPPQVLPAPVKLDYHCTTDADCTVKDVGNCCGMYPACVNRDSPADPAAVQAQCAKEGRMSVCGFREIDACSCSQGQCEPRDDASQEPLR